MDLADVGGGSWSLASRTLACCIVLYLAYEFSCFWHLNLFMKFRSQRVSSTQTYVRILAVHVHACGGKSATSTVSNVPVQPSMLSSVCVK